MMKRLGHGASSCEFLPLHWSSRQMAKGQADGGDHEDGPGGQAGGDPERSSSTWPGAAGPLHWPGLQVNPACSLWVRDLPRPGEI